MAEIRKLGRKTDHRLAMLKNLTTSVIWHGQIETTEAKAKEVKSLAESAKVAIRNIRRDMNDQLKKMEKDGEITEDQLKRSNDDVQKSVDKTIAIVDEIAKDKETQIMEI